MSRFEARVRAGDIVPRVYPLRGAAMNKNIRNIIIGVGVAVALGFFFGLTESLTRVRWGFLGTWFPVMMGAFTYYILFNLSGTRKESKADAAALADAMAF